MILGICRFCGSSDVRLDVTDYENCFGACRSCNATGPVRVGPEAAGRAWNNGLDGPVLAAIHITLDTAPPIARHLRGNPRAFVDVMSLLADRGEEYARELVEHTLTPAPRDQAAAGFLATLGQACAPAPTFEEG